MKEANYSFYAYLGAVLVLAIILLFGLFSAYQPSRMFATAMAYELEAVERGGHLYQQDCATCHGRRGEGVRGSGPALNTKEFLEEAPDALIFNTITDGRPGTSMPAWGQARGGPYNPQDVEDLVSYIRSWEATAPSMQELVHRGDPVEGAVLFSTTCYACHGVSGEGTSSGLQLNDPGLLAKYDDDYFRNVIARGRPDRGMPTWGSVLSPVQVEDLVAYIRSWQRKTPAAMATLGGDAARGKDIFNSTCLVCHGAVGSGTDIAPPLIEAEILGSLDALYTVISDGRLEVGMPKWGQVLSPAEINDVIAYLGTLGTGGVPAEADGASEESEDDAALKAVEFLYIQQCATCHGFAGEGRDDKPALANSEFIQGNDDEAISIIIANGRANTAMEGFAGELSEDEMRSLVQFIRRWQ
jgi:mono/diheme cytochrome c family protein